MPKNGSRYRRILHLRDVKKFTFEEIGKLLGFSRQRAWELYKRAQERVNSGAPNTNAPSCG